MWLFHLQCSTGRWQSHVPATALPFVTHSQQCQGWLCTQTGDRHSGPAVWLAPNILSLLGSLDFQLVEDDSPVGLGELSWETLLIFHFLPHTPPLSLKCFNCFYWAGEEKISKVGFCQSNHLVVSILIMKVGLCSLTFGKAILNCCWRTSLEKSSRCV